MGVTRPLVASTSASRRIRSFIITNHSKGLEEGEEGWGGCPTPGEVSHGESRGTVGLGVPRGGGVAAAFPMNVLESVSLYPVAKQEGWFVLAVVPRRSIFSVVSSPLLVRFPTYFITLMFPRVNVKKIIDSDNVKTYPSLEIQLRDYSTVNQLPSCSTWTCTGLIQIKARSQYRVLSFSGRRRTI